MPLYEYRCRACGAQLEELRRPVDADVPVDCACGQPDTVRLPSLVARGGGAALPLAGGSEATAGGGCCGGGCCST